jgi:nucleolar complex protein 3
LTAAIEELDQASAVYDQTKILQLQSETLKYLFLTFFRILKNAPKSPLIPQVLEGLSRFAYLINVDFFQDILKLLKNISQTQLEMYRLNVDSNVSSALSSLHSITSAFELLDSIGGAIETDLREFYVGLYTQIMRISFRPGVFDRRSEGRDEVELVMAGIESMLRKREVYSFTLTSRYQ